MSDRKPKIAFLGTRGIPAGYSGFETFVEQLSVRLVQRGWDVTVFNRYPFVPLRERIYRGVRIVRLRTIQRKSLDTLVHTFLSCLWLPFLRPDVVYFCGVGNAIFCLIPKLLGIPAIINVDGEDWARKKWSGFAVKWLRWSERWACKYANVVIADSRAISRRYAELYNRKTIYIPYGANIRLAKPGTATLDRFGLQPEEYILFVGRLVPENRAELLISVFNTIETSRKLVIVGDAPYSEDYKRELQTLAGPNVVFTGYAFGEAYEQLSAHCLFYVLSSGVNGTRPVLLDQMGFGNCVLVRNSLSNAEVAGGAAVQFDDANESTSLRAALVRLLEDRDLILEYRKKAVARVREAYDWERITDEYGALFSSLAGCSCSRGLRPRDPVPVSKKPATVKNSAQTPGRDYHCRKAMDSLEFQRDFARAGSEPRQDGIRLAVGGRKEAEAEIQPSEAPNANAARDNYVTHFDLAQVGLVHLDGLGMIYEANPMAIKLLDCDPAQLLSGKLPFVAQVAPESRTVFLEHFDLVLRSDEKETCEIMLQSRTGAEVPVRMESVRSLRANGTADIFVTLANLTARRHLEAMLEEQKRIAESAVVAKELFFSMLSHELRTPLTPVLAAVEEMESAPGRSAEDLAAFAVIRRNLELAASFVDDLLDLTQITAGQIEMEPEITDAHALLTEAFESSRAQIAARGLRVKAGLNAPRYFVEADPARLAKVFGHLVKNVVNFASPGSDVVIESACDLDSRLIIEFHDTGISIDWWPLGHMFDPFFRSYQSEERRFGGMGLGLAISKAIVEAHGGTLTAASGDAGKGATFRLELPAVVAPQPNPPVVAKKFPEEAARLNGLRLLLVEDHDDTRQVLEKLLRRRGYIIEAARDAVEARALCGAQQFDLMICDLALPEISGFDLMKELNREHGLRAISMSGFGAESDIAQGKAAGFLDHLTKPVDAQQLDAAIQRVVRISD